MSSAEELKNQGNLLFSSGNFEEAVDVFTLAITADPENAVLYSNRSAAHASLKQWSEALSDAQKTTELRPEWGKGWSRLGSALQGRGDYKDAHEAFAKGLEVDPSNAQLQKGLESTEAAMKAPPAREFPNPFGGADVMARLQADPRTASLLSDPSFLAKIADLRANPQNVTKYLQEPGMMDVLSVLLNFNMSEASGETQSCGDKSCKDSSCASDNGESVKQQPAAQKVKPVAEESKEESEAKRFKELGTEAYKARNFEKALECYEAAYKLTPQNGALLLNQSAVHFEAGDFELAVKKATEAIDCARCADKPSDYAFYGKAYARIANSLVKLDRLEEAVKFYNKSLTENRIADTLTRLRETERLISERAKAALHSPELAEAARTEGNAHFKDGRFVEAVTAYSEAIRRDEKDPRAYSNRAACYLKLAAIPEGLKDCERAIQLDPKFIRAYIRKAALQFAKKDFSECLETCDLATTLDTDQKHSSEIQSQRTKATFEIYRQNHQQQQQSHGSQADDEAAIADKISKDPELASIVSDPAMRMILQQMQTDPAAIQEHMKNPSVAAKIRKLVSAGIIRTA
jgi:stress-induced-phosphoprotein 1